MSQPRGLIPKRKNPVIQNVREMVTALNIISARQVSSDQAPKVLRKEFHDNFLICVGSAKTAGSKATLSKRTLEV